MTAEAILPSQQAQAPEEMTAPDRSGKETGEFFLEMNALAAGLPLEIARTMSPAELDHLADLNELLLGS